MFLLNLKLILPLAQSNWHSTEAHLGVALSDPPQAPQNKELPCCHPQHRSNILHHFPAHRTAWDDIVKAENFRRGHLTG